MDTSKHGPKKAGPIGPMGSTVAQARPTARSQARPAKEPLEACCRPCPAERVYKGRRPLPPATPRPPFARPAPDPSPLPSHNPNPRSSLDPSTAPLPSRLRLDLTVFSNSNRRLAAVGRPLYPLLFVFLPTFASSPVDSLPQLKSVPKPGHPSINLVDPAILDLAGVLGAPDLLLGRCKAVGVPGGLDLGSLDPNRQLGSLGFAGRREAMTCRRPDLPSRPWTTTRATPSTMSCG
ncbi:translation initiation factor IF-2-like [Panicum virgatum]|uniref:Uncharacterized protein n=1 Tax=Panicum virgatum TaxID=38727 RepID=A0A8T0PJW9_PANVG|nr:translation initiation factor IF-2-like [Panicum virgatum]KAG2560929.1 hypothetical protein PVAP13_8KG195104 [Panicum virgatum]